MVVVLTIKNNSNGNIFGFILKYVLLFTYLDKVGLVGNYIGNRFLYHISYLPQNDQK